MKILVTAFLSFGIYISVTAQNVGVNTPVPVENLQVDSCIKVGKNTTLAGAKKNLIKFGDDAFVTIGEEVGDDKMYLRYGTLSLMRSDNSIGNGYMGIQTEAPTATLDVNGSFRLRGNNAVNGRVLVTDASGVASWTGAIAFSARSVAAGTTVPSNSSSGAVFGAMEYETNPGTFTFNPTKFTAPVGGIYHFSGSVMVANSSPASFRLLFNKSDGSSKQIDYETNATGGVSLPFGFDMNLSAGASVQVFLFNFSAGTATILGAGSDTFFTGHLVR